METPDIIGTAAGGAGGAVALGALVKWLIQYWIKKSDERAEKTTTTVQVLSDKTADKLEAIMVELGKISVRLEHLQTSADATAELGKALAVVDKRVEGLERGLNGLGAKVRSLNGG